MKMINFKLINKFYEREKKLTGVFEESRKELRPNEIAILDAMIKDYKQEKYPEKRYSSLLSEFTGLK